MRKLSIARIPALLVLSAFISGKKAKLKLPEEFAHIPAGSYYTASEGEDPYYYGRSKTKRPQDSARIEVIGDFYISKYEVTNLQYRQFVAESLPVLPEQEREKILCDTTGWNRVLSYGAPMNAYYYGHPAYSNYPVVNIRHEGALKYCEWLQQRIQKANPDFEVEIRLPSRHQWSYAAMGGRSQAMYPWGNYYLRNKKGEFLCNFKVVGDQAIVRNRETGLPVVMESFVSGRGIFLAAVKSFDPNDYGIYNICGNAAEMINEKGICMGGSWDDYGGDITTRSETKYEKSTPTVGFRPIIIISEKRN